MPVSIYAFAKAGGGCVKNDSMLLFSTPVQLEDHVPATILVTWRLTQLMRRGGHTPPVESVGLCLGCFMMLTALQFITVSLAAFPQQFQG